MENSLGEIKRRMGMALLPATHNRGNPETQRLFQANLDRRWLVGRLEGAEAKAARLEARLIDSGHVSDDVHQQLRRESGDYSSEPYHLEVNTGDDDGK